MLGQFLADFADQNTWLRFAVTSELGGVLLALRRYDEAESLLLEGYAGLIRHKAKIPA